MGALLTPPDRLNSLPHTKPNREWLPNSVDLSKYFPAVGDQGNEGSCVAWATGYAARAYYALQIDHRQLSSPANIPSPAYIYNSIVDSSENEQCQSGTYIVDALELLKNGSLSLAEYPYTEGVCPKPTANEKSSARDFYIQDFLVVDHRDVNQVEAEIAHGNPVIISVALDDGFNNLHGPSGRRPWMSTEDTAITGFHAITVVGYNDEKRLFKFINSWSTEWGDEGFGWISFETFVARAKEAFVMRLPGNPPITLLDADINNDDGGATEEQVLRVPPYHGTRK
jgi:C1A family cysteine protease